MSLSFVGLGLYDERDITLKGRDAIADADSVYVEFYTSILPAAPLEDLEEFHATDITQLSRDDVENQPEFLLDEAEDEDVVFLSGGDAMVSTTHADLRLRALERGIETEVIHAPSIQTAVSGVTGLQNYRFGQSTTLPFPQGDWKPESPYDVVVSNLERDLHTLVFLDIKVEGEDERFMKASEGARLLSELDDENEIGRLVGVARAGSDSPEVAFGTPDEVAESDLGSPLHVLIVPASLHDVERETLEYVSVSTD
ncbi:MAG: diphthine synthase [Halobacteria archaeon]|nr:diphthine synthase [Halobacteria archaeon]